MTFRLSYEITEDQQTPGQAGRVTRIELECEPASADEVTEALNGFLTAITGEREALHRETRGYAGGEEGGGL